MTQHSSARRPVTRGDVARYAGVSTAVVSYVVNNGPRPVAPETAERVREAMELLQYRPNLSARALKSGTSHTLGLILADTLNPHCVEMSFAVTQAAAETGHRVLVADSRGDAACERALVDDLLARQVDGLVFASTFGRVDPLADVRSIGVPVVLLDCPGPIPGRATVGPAARQGVETLVRHLAETHGRRSIALVIGRDGFGDPDPRELGWIEELARLGLPRGPVVRGGWGRESGHLAGLELLGHRPMPDAVVAASDRLALGLLRALHEAGVDVPGQVAVVSFDGTHESAYSWPPLTCVRQPCDLMGRLVLDLIDDPAPGHREFVMDLVIRSSCGCRPTTQQPL